MARILLAGVLLTASLPAAQAARVSVLRGGVTPNRARVVMNLDSPLSYTARVTGNQLIVDLKGKADRTEMVRLRDPRIQKAYLEPQGKNSRLVVVFQKTVPVYKIFLLKNPQRLVVDFPRSGTSTGTAGKPAAGSSQWLGKGLTYRESTVNLGAGRVKTYLLTLAPSSDFRLDFIPGYGKTIQRGTLSMIQKRSGAVALVNASYFDSDIWVVGNLKIQNKWLGMESTPRTGLVIPRTGTPSIQPGLSYTGTVTRPDGKSFAIGGLNRMRLQNELILYNDGYDDTTDTNAYGTEVLLNGGIVRDIRKGAGSMALAPGTTVLSGNGSAAAFLNGLRTGDKVTVTQTLGNQAADSAASVGSAGPQLVRDGRVQVTSEEEEIADDIAQGRAPRTGVGIKKDGTVLIVVADGRSDSSVGMTLTEFGRYFVQLGADRAMNFDGGGSSEMVVNGKIMNDPSDGSERPVRVALGVFRK
ncbi:phosphodiester glycosidase family protein [uncultured Acidaminococcus sp.]|uniref:phosphodiester glycosidase family protein n=1 Tax=uncultured Acidaminococcus sp. TaxID=352152 RepID=UPI002941FE0A|nr:phosphodiester glycosidase family protein [uncultured Acidaminococcus sp.]